MKDDMKNLSRGLIETSLEVMRSGQTELPSVVRQDLEEALHGKQYKLDVNSNGKVDSHDFKLLRRKKQMKEALDRGVHKSHLVQIKSPGYPELNESIGQLVHFDRVKKIATIVVEGKTFKVRAGQYAPVTEELLAELSTETKMGYVKAAAKDAKERMGKMDPSDAANNKKISARFKGMNKALKEDEESSDELTEETEQLDEISGKTAGSYIKKAKEQAADTYKGRGRKSAGTLKLRAKREDGIKKAEAIVAKHHKARWEAREKEMKANAAEFMNHVDSTHADHLAKHGYKLVNEGHHDNNRVGEKPDHVKTYIKHHDNGHSTMVSVVKRGDAHDQLYFHGGHEIRAVNTKGTSWSSYNPYHNHGDDLEHSKKKFDVDFHDHLKKITESGGGKGNW